jgi:hypothetical protein
MEFIINGILIHFSTQGNLETGFQIRRERYIIPLNIAIDRARTIGIQKD